LNDNHNFLDDQILIYIHYYILLNYFENIFCYIDENENINEILEYDQIFDYNKIYHNYYNLHILLIYISHIVHDIYDQIHNHVHLNVLLFYYIYSSKMNIFLYIFSIFLLKKYLIFLKILFFLLLEMKMLNLLTNY